LTTQIGDGQESPENLAALLCKVPTTVAKEVLHDLGVTRIDLRGLSPLVPTAGVVAGRARTLRYLPAREDAPASPRGAVGRQAVEALRPGDVLVIDAMGMTEGAVLGDMLGTRASMLGAAGVVVDGVVRDVQSLRALGLAVYARGTQPDPNRVHLNPWEKDVPIQCGGRLVQPGDWILADADAVLVVPEELAPEVARLGAEKLLAEEFSQDLLRSGSALDDAYPIPPARRQEFDRYRAARTPCPPQ
jgi:regulator of RNase E activity RraA